MKLNLSIEEDDVNSKASIDESNEVISYPYKEEEDEVASYVTAMDEDDAHLDVAIEEEDGLHPVVAIVEDDMDPDAEVVEEDDMEPDAEIEGGEDIDPDVEIEGEEDTDPDDEVEEGGNDLESVLRLVEASRKALMKETLNLNRKRTIYKLSLKIVNGFGEASDHLEFDHTVHRCILTCLDSFHEAASKIGGASPLFNHLESHVQALIVRASRHAEDEIHQDPHNADLLRRINDWMRPLTILHADSAAFLRDTREVCNESGILVRELADRFPFIEWRRKNIHVPVSIGHVLRDRLRIVQEHVNELLRILANHDTLVSRFVEARIHVQNGPMPV